MKRTLTVLLVIAIALLAACSSPTPAPTAKPPTAAPAAATQAPATQAPATQAAATQAPATQGAATQAPATKAAAAPSGAPIKIGAAFSLTGYLAMEKFQAEGAQMAVASINAKGGVLGRPLELTIEDMKSDPAQEATLVTKLITQQKVNLMASGASSAGNEAAAPILADNEIPIIVNSVLPKDPKWTVSTLPSSELFIQIQFQYLKSIGVTKVADVHNPTPYNKSMVEVGQRVGQSLGITFVGSEEVAADATTMVIPLTKIKDKKPDAVVFFPSGPATFVAAKDMASLGMTIPLVLPSDDTSNLFKAAEAYKYTVFPVMPAQAYPDVPDPAMKANLDTFMPMWRAKYPQADPLYAAAGWDQITALAKGIEKAGSVDGKKVMAALETLEFPGVEAVYKFTPDNHFGIKTNPMRVGQLENGKLKIILTLK